MKYLKLIGLLIAFVMFASCSGTKGGADGVGDAGGTSPVSIVLGGTQGASLQKNDNFLLAIVHGVVDFLSPAEANAFIPQEVSRVIILITGSNFTFFEEVIVGPNDDQIIVTFPDVPNEENITFEARSFNPIGTVNYEGRTVQTISGGSGVTNRVEIFMQVADPALNAKVYVSNSFSNNVSAIDPLSFLEQRLECPQGSDCAIPLALAVSHDGSRGLVPFGDSDHVINIDTSVPELDREISDSFSLPRAVAFRCDDAEAWVVNANNDSVSIINTADDSVANLTTPAGTPPCSFDSPETIALANGKAYIGNEGNSTICVVDIASRGFLMEIDYTPFITGFPVYEEASADGQFVYAGISGDGEGAVLKIDTATDTIVNLAAVQAKQLALSPDGETLFFGPGDGSLGFIETANMSSGFIGITGQGIDISGVEVLKEAGGLGFASDSDNARVFIFNPANRTIVQYRDGTPVTVPVGTFPNFIASQPAPVTNCGPFTPVDPLACIIEEGNGDGDAGDLVASPAQIAIGEGELVQISGNLGSANDVDVYEIQLTGSPFVASTQSPGTPAFDTQLFLFNSSEFGEFANDDTGACVKGGAVTAGCASRLEPVATPPAGRYFIAITSHANHPSSTAGQIFPNDNPQATVGPTGPGGGSTLFSYPDKGNSSGSYFITFENASAECIPDP